MRQKHDLQRWLEALKRLADAPRVVYDAETSGLDWRKHHVVGHVLTFGPDPADSYYLPIRHAGGGNIGDLPGPSVKEHWGGVPHSIEQTLIQLLDRPDLEVIGHHLNFDLRFLWRLGLQFKAKFVDTMVNATLLDEWQGKFGLEYCANLAGVFAKRSELITDHLCQQFPADCAPGGKGDMSPMGHFWRLRGDDPVAVDYATGDGTSTWQLRDWQQQKLEKQDLTKVQGVENRLIPVLARMSAVGIKIDEEQLESLIDSTHLQLVQLMNGFPSGFNVRSNNDVRRWCEKHGHTDWPHTPGRVRLVTVDDVEAGLCLPQYIGEKHRVPAPSFPEAWLKTHAAGQQVVDVRKIETLRSTFLLPMRETHLWKGRVHTTYNQLRNDEYGTVTGRLSASDPNLTAVSKHDKKIGRQHRSIFIPDDSRTRPGQRMRWASVDYSQIEPRLLAYYARCRVLIDGYNATPPIDAHTAASAACNPNWPNMSDKERKDYRDNIGKRVNQTIITGGGKGVLIDKYGVPADVAQKVIDAYFDNMDGVRQLQYDARHKMQAYGYVYSLLGRRARLHDRNLSYMAVNRLLQCGNADIIKLKMVEIDEYLASVGRPLDLLNSIHDDLAFQFDEEQRPHFEQCLKIMTNFGPDQLIYIDVVPMAVEVGEGENWSVATYGPTSHDKPDDSLINKVPPAYVEQHESISSTLHGKAVPASIDRRRKRR